MIIEIKDKCLKARQGKYVVYDVDYLLSHLAGEVALLWNSQNRKAEPLDKNKIWREIEKGENDKAEREGKE